MRVNQPFFTIAIPTYNRCQFLKLAVISVLKQNFKDYEILVVDNDSPDETAAIVRELQKQTNKIRYIKQPYNVGPPKNFKRCFYEAQGKYLFTLADDDMILKSDTLKTVYTYIKKYHPGFVKIGAIFYHKQPKNIVKGMLFKRKLEIVKPHDPNMVFKTYDKYLEFMSGSVYKLSRPDFSLINTNDYLYLTLEYAFYMIDKYGALFIGDHYIFGRYLDNAQVDMLVIPVFSLDTSLTISKKFIANPSKYNKFDSSVRRNMLVYMANFKLFANQKISALAVWKTWKDDKNRLSHVFHYLFALVCLITPKVFLKTIKKMLYGRFIKEVNLYIRKHKLSQYFDELTKAQDLTIYKS